jgi:hypothetical protein
LNYNLFNLRKKRKKLKNKEYLNIFWVFEFELGYQTFWVFGFGIEYWVYTQYSNPNAWVFWVHMSESTPIISIPNDNNILSPFNDVASYWINFIVFLIVSMSLSLRTISASSFNLFIISSITTELKKEYLKKEYPKKNTFWGIS